MENLINIEIPKDIEDSICEIKKNNRRFANWLRWFVLGIFLICIINIGIYFLMPNFREHKNAIIMICMVAWCIFKFVQMNRILRAHSFIMDSFIRSSKVEEYIAKNAERVSGEIRKNFEIKAREVSIEDGKKYLLNDLKSRIPIPF